MPLRFALVFAFAATLLVATEKKSVPNCCTSGAARVSPKQVDALLEKTEPILVPCCGHKLHIEGTIVLAMAVRRQRRGNLCEYSLGAPTTYWLSH